MDNFRASFKMWDKVHLSQNLHQKAALKFYKVVNIVKLIYEHLDSGILHT